jgi:hypothetical protein
MEITLDLDGSARPRLHALPPLSGRQDAGDGEGLVLESGFVLADVDRHTDAEEAIFTFPFRRLANHPDEVEGGMHHAGAVWTQLSD